MDNSFFAYMQHLELMAFFSGYVLIYAVVGFVAPSLRLKNNFSAKIVSLLPFSYSLVGTLFLGLQLKKIYESCLVEHLKFSVQQPLFIIWGLASLIFWIPAVAKKTVLSLLHSLVFFLFLLKDLFVQFYIPSSDPNIVRNDMAIYTNSLILNAGAFTLVLLSSLLYNRYRKK